MPQGMNSTMCVGQAKHYQLCQQQVRTTSSTPWCLLGDVGLRGSCLELQEHQALRVRLVPRGVSADKGYDSLLEWLTVTLKMGEVTSTLWDSEVAEKDIKPYWLWGGRRDKDFPVCFALRWK